MRFFEKGQELLLKAHLALVLLLVPDLVLKTQWIRGLIRHTTHSAVPSGLMQIQISVPNVETLGYYRPSLRDDEWQILLALDKNVRAPEKSDAHSARIGSQAIRPRCSHALADKFAIFEINNGDAMHPGGLD